MEGKPTSAPRPMMAIAALVLGLIMLLVLLLLCVVSVSMGAAYGPGVEARYAELQRWTMPASMCLLALVPVSLVGVGLGIAAAIRNAKGRALAIVGIVLNALYVCAMVSLLVIGFLM
jgi:hypothetical protein